MNETYLEYLSLREFYKRIIDYFGGTTSSNLVTINGREYNLNKIIKRLDFLEGKLFKDYKQQV